MPAARAEVAPVEPVPLQLDVRVNGEAINLIAAFILLPDGAIASPRSELTELGINVPGEGPPDEIIPLQSIPSLTYSYDEEAQAIDLEVANMSRLAKRVEVGRRREYVEAGSDVGLVLNYTAFAGANYSFLASEEDFNGANLSLDARAFSSLGTLRQTGILGTTTFDDMTAVRLDTTWAYSFQEKMLTARLGDIISGGLRWTRPIRMGGGQLQRNFRLRPDLITIPLPSLDGSAEVPSTLDVYINGTKSYSTKVDAGPFYVDNLPVFTGQGTARLVLTDTTGRQTESETPFYSSPDMLKKDLYDFSIDGGFARRGFGTDSFDYDSDPIAIASLRYGIADMLTGEAHVELGAGLAEGGVGAVLQAGPIGQFNGAVAASQFGGDTGLFVYGGWQAEFGDFTIQASTARTIGDFYDLAAVTEEVDAFSSPGSSVPIAVDLVALTYSFPEQDASISLSAVHRETRDDESFILGGYFSKSFDNDISAYASAFFDLSSSGDYGAFVGFSMPMGKTMHGSSEIGLTGDGWAATASVSRQADGTPGSYGWQVGHRQTDEFNTTAYGTYYSEFGRISGRASATRAGATADAAIEGSLVAMRSGLFMGNTIYDSFAIVDVGIPDVEVKSENRPVGRTGEGGKLLVTQLRAYQNNKISINPDDLPLNSSLSETDVVVAPRDMSGIVVDFGVRRETTTAIVVLTDGGGNHLPPGTEVMLEGVVESFVVGYDCEVYVTDLRPENALTADMNGRPCRAEFAFAPDETTQTAIGPVKCL